ncbi:MAG: PorP/SprF family type IX secretion system membrane protein [Bacteroidia bacterium]|nr:PorP/SprF family type IX secretion system membrane protein [Bacteroidia bacterium]
MKKLIITLSIVIVGLAVKAQQVPLLSHYYYNKFVWNPALAGFQKYGQAYLVYRNQWNRVPGAPITKSLTVDGPLKSKNVGLGANLYQDNAGMFNRTGGMISYAYGINFSENSKLKLGMGLGFIDNRLSTEDMIYKHPDDPLLQLNNNNKTGFDANFGVNYTYKDFNFGVSIPQVLALDIKYEQPNKSELVYKNTRHFQFNTSYMIKAMEDKLKIEPSAFVRLTPNAPLQYDVSAVASYRDMIWGGVMYRSKYAFGMMAGLRLAKQFVLGYAHDITVNSNKTYLRGANEVLLGFQFGSGTDDEELKKRLKGIDDRLDGDKAKIEDLDKRVKTNSDDIEKNKDDIKKNTNDNTNQSDDINTLKRMFEELKSKLGKGTVEVGDVYEFQNVYFATNRYDLSNEAKAELDQLVSVMKENPSLKIEISGHTDDRGTPEYNQRLSERRSKSVIDYLVSKGVSKDRLTVFSYGEAKPASSDLSANRRVEFKVIEK